MVSSTHGRSCPKAANDGSDTRLNEYHAERVSPVLAAGSHLMGIGHLEAGKRP
jgi:hypothetical protein